MNEKTYLNGITKVGYGSGDIAGNVVYAFLSSFVMIYLTNTIGLIRGLWEPSLQYPSCLTGLRCIFWFHDRQDQEQDGKMQDPGCSMAISAVPLP